MTTLAQLAIYPIKSCAQIPLTEALLGPFGLEMDRRWMLVDDTGHMLTQRQYARMCLIHCSLDNGQLAVTAPEMPSLSIEAASTASLVKATIWHDTCNAYDCGDAPADWFSHFLGTTARLVYFPDNELRQVDMDYASQGDITAFSDGFPYLIISQASLDDLNSRLASPVEMKRFRPNLVIKDTEAFAEDGWKKIRIGEIIFNIVKPCSRCIIPSINPESAEKNADVLKTLTRYRMRENKIYFGQNVIAEGTGKLKVDMPVEVLA